jgi:hypothetical protein
MPDQCGSAVLEPEKDWSAEKLTAITIEQRKSGWIINWYPVPAL